MCGQVVNTSNSGSGGLEPLARHVVSLDKVGTLLHFVSFHPGV